MLYLPRRPNPDRGSPEYRLRIREIRAKWDVLRTLVPLEPAETSP